MTMGRNLWRTRARLDIQRVTNLFLGICHKTTGPEQSDGSHGHHNGESSFTSSDALAAAQHQLGTVPAGPGECAEAEGVDVGQREEVGSLVESLGVAD